MKRDRVSKKISRLRREEGVPQEQAVATALNMKRAGRLTPTGGYVRARGAARRQRSNRRY